MAKQKKGGGFNSPFSALKTAEPKKAPAATPGKASGKPAPARAPSTATPGATEPSLSDRELFLRAAAGAEGVARRPSARIEPEKRQRAETPDDDALVVAELEALVSGDAPFVVEDTGEETSGTAPGVSRAVLAELKRGDYAFRRHIDLHGFDREAGHLALIEFLSTARRDGERCVLVITGKGKRSPGGVSVLREALPRWLSRAPLGKQVLAFSTARPVDGGAGAFYVLLRRTGAF